MRNCNLVEQETKKDSKQIRVKINHLFCSYNWDYMREYLVLLRRWINKYNQLDVEICPQWYHPPLHRGSRRPSESWTGWGWLLRCGAHHSSRGECVTRRQSVCSRGTIGWRWCTGWLILRFFSRYSEADKFQWYSTNGIHFLLHYHLDSKSEICEKMMRKDYWRNL